MSWVVIFSLKKKSNSKIKNSNIYKKNIFNNYKVHLREISWKIAPAGHGFNESVKIVPLRLLTFPVGSWRGGLANTKWGG